MKHFMKYAFLAASVVVAATLLLPTSAVAGQYDGVWEGELVGSKSYCGFEKKIVQLTVQGDKIIGEWKDGRNKLVKIDGEIIKNKIRGRSGGWTIIFNGTHSTLGTITGKIVENILTGRLRSDYMGGSCNTKFKLTNITFKKQQQEEAALKAENERKAREAEALRIQQEKEEAEQNSEAAQLARLEEEKRQEAERTAEELRKKDRKKTTKLEAAKKRKADAERKQKLEEAKRKNEVEEAKRRQQEKLANDRALVSFINDPATSPLFDGGKKDLVVLFNDSGSSINGTRTLLGDVEFENGIANVCRVFDLDIEKGFNEFIKDELLKKGASQFSKGFGEFECQKLEKPSWDLLVFERGSFLKQKIEVVKPILENVQDAFFSVFYIANETEYQSAIQSRLNLAQRIEGEVRAGTREGYGILIVDNDATAFCAEESSQQDVVSNLINTVNETLPKSLKQSKANIVYSSLDQTFKDLKRGDCRFFFGNAKSLQLVEKGLKRDRKSVAFHYEWIKLDDFDRVAADIRQSKEETAQEREARKRKAVEEAALREERLKASGEIARRELAEMRKKAGPKARAIASNVKVQIQNYIEASSSDGLWAIVGDFKKWHSTRKQEQWEFMEVESEVEDYGQANWKGRVIESAVITSHISMQNKILGVRKEACFNIAFINDSEFEMARNIKGFFNVKGDEKILSCNGTASPIAIWKSENAFASQWKLSKEATLQ